MSGAALVHELENLGVRLWEDSGTLRFRAPHGVMTEDRRQALRAQRDAVIEHLRRSDSSAVAKHYEATRHDPFPLTDLQTSYLLGRHGSIAYGSVACHAYGELTFADLDAPRLERAWQQVIRRHDMLRAVIDNDGSQRVLPDPPAYRIAVADVRRATSAEAQRALDVTRAELDHQIHPLGVWPMFELRITLTTARAILHLSIDFLIADYVSLQVVLDELRALYLNPGVVLPPLGITFRDYLLAERAVRSGSRYERDFEYWRGRMDTLPPAPELPILDAAGSASSTLVRFRRFETRLHADAANALQRRAQRSGVTPSSAVLGAYADAIARWSRHPRFCINVTVLQRLPVHPDVDRLVGDFTTVNLLGIDLRPSAAFGDRVREIQARLWEDLDHRLFSGVEVMRELTCRRSTAAALMPVVYTSAIGLGPRRPGVNTLQDEGELVYGISQTPQVWIDCQVMQRGGGIVASWDVREGLFPRGVVDDMFDAFRRLLHNLASEDGPWHRAGSIALPAHQQERRRRANDTAASVPQGLLHDGFLAMVQVAPERPAVIGGGHSMTYAGLLSRATAVATRLMSEGARAGEAIGVWMEKGPNQVVAVVGTLLAGCAYLPIDSDQPELRRTGMLTNAGVRYLLTQSTMTDAGPSSMTRIDVDTLDALAVAPAAECPRARPDDLAYIIYTSGSTGSPKGVIITHRAALNTIVDINRRFAIGHGDRVLALANLGFDLSVYDIFGTLAAGGCVVMPAADRRSDPSHWADLIADCRVTVWNSVPAQLQMLHDYLERTPLGLPSLRLAMLSGDWIPLALPGQIRAQLPSLQVVSLGGATEASIWSIAFPIDRVDPAWRSIPYGTPLANQTFHVLDEALQDRPDMVTGELYIGGIGVAQGYLADPDKTAERFIEHPLTGERLYRTGDLGRYQPDGTIEFLGREDSQVKIRGHRIDLSEIEAALREHPGVGRAVAVVYGDSPTQRRLAAFVEPAPRRDGADDGEARWLAEAVTRQIGDPDPGDTAQVVRFALELDRTALQAMLGAFDELGLFGSGDTTHSLDEIIAAGPVAPRHHRLVRRWLNALERHKFIERDATQRYRRMVELGRDALDAAWRRIDQFRPTFDRRTELIEYFRLASRRLPELLRGELDPMRLLFPEGRVEIHEAAYNDNFLSRYLNQAVTLAVTELAGTHSQPGGFRVLEAGAGVGGTSAELVPALAAHGVAYLFTDVSPFFLNNARERFRDVPWVSYALFDINRDYRDQRLLPNSFDAIVCANVLHYARDAATVVGRLRELLRPGGWLIFIEMVRDNYQVLTSMEFLFDATAGDFEDVRAGRDETFISLQQWRQLLADAGAEIGLCVPSPGDALAEIGFHVFAARFKQERTPLHPLELGHTLLKRLPEYMIPLHLQIVDAMPLTDNGKVDRARLRAWIPADAASTLTTADDDPASDLERRLAEVWQSVLRVEHVGRHQDFFRLGGDSLLASQLVGRMREEVREAGTVFFDALLRWVLDGPTVAKLAAQLEQLAARGGAQMPADVRSSPLVHLKTSTEGPLRVLLHDASGTIASYAALLDDLAASGSLAALVVNDDTYVGTQTAALVRRSAAVYAQALETTSRLPLHLIGCDVGGILAVEVARHLLEAGRTSVSLTVINSLPVPYIVDDELFTEYLFARGAGVDPVRLGYPAEGPLVRAIEGILDEHADRIPLGALEAVSGDTERDGVGWCFRRLGARQSEDRLATVARLVNVTSSNPAPPGQIRALYDVFRHSLRAFALHEIGPYAGNVTLVRSKGGAPLWPAATQDVAAFWQRVCLGELHVVDVDGDGLAVLRPPMSARVLRAIGGVGEAACR